MPSIAFSVGGVTVEPCDDGVYILVGGKCLARIDLYHFPVDPEDPEGEGFPQVVLYTGDDGDDPLVHARWQGSRFKLVLDNDFEWAWVNTGTYLEMEGKIG